MLSKVKAFTLVELLVVVLIIGILVAVAVPQYQKAVFKADASRTFVVLKTIGQAQEAYYLANGSYASSLEMLDIQAPAKDSCFSYTHTGTSVSAICPKNSVAVARRYDVYVSKGEARWVCLPHGDRENGKKWCKVLGADISVGPDNTTNPRWPIYM